MGRTDATHRNRGRALAQALVEAAPARVKITDAIGEDRAWRDAVGGDPVRAELQRKCLGEPGHAASNAVRKHEVRYRLAHADRGDEHDARLVRFLQVRQRRADQPDRAHQGELVGGVPCRELGGLEGPGRRAPCIHDQDVQPTQRRHRRLDRGFRLARLGDIGRLPAGGADLFGRGLDRPGVTGDDEDAGSLAGESFGAREAQALAGRGHKCLATCETKVHEVIFAPSRQWRPRGSPRSPPGRSGSTETRGP